MPTTTPMCSRTSSNCEVANMRKTVLITGASGGLGLEFARIYAREGFDLVVVARSEGKLYKLKSELETQYDCRVWVLAQDLSQPDAAYEVFNYTLEKNITIDALVNNAGFGDFGNFWEVDAQRQTDLLQVNIMTLVQLTRYFLPGMVERRHGSVLNLSSVAAFSAGPRMCLYYASKEFVRSFSEAVAEEVRSTGVTVTALCPGPTATGFEQAAQMKNSHMFSMFKPASAAAVAEAGFRAAQKGKTLRYCGWPTHTVSIAARLLPRSVCRRFMMKVNG